MDLVVDASVTLAWCFGEDTDGVAERVLDEVRDGRAEASAPAIWPGEVANGLLMAERSGRIRPADTARLVTILGNLPVAVETSGIGFAGTITLPLAREHRLTVYDACYLELAERLGARLATLDADLRKAAEAVGVALAA